METTKNHEQTDASPLAKLRFDVIESETDRLLPGTDEMGGSSYIISVEDGKSVATTALQQLDLRGMFVVSPTSDKYEEIIEKIGNYFSEEGVTLTNAVDIALMVCARDKLLKENIIRSNNE